MVLPKLHFPWPEDHFGGKFLGKKKTKIYVSTRVASNAQLPSTIGIVVEGLLALKLHAYTGQGTDVTDYLVYCKLYDPFIGKKCLIVGDV